MKASENAGSRLLSALRLGVLLFLVAPILSAQNNPIFNGPRDYLVGSYPQSVVVADFNGDGLPDIATANNSSNNISILLQNANGTFQAAVNYPVGNGPVSLQVGDVNNDGNLDLIVINVTDSTVAVLLGNGDGTFQAPKTTPIPGTPPPFPYLAVGDFNADGNLDVVITMALAQVGTYGAGIMLGNGDGTFQAPVTYQVSGYPVGLVAADFNNDSKLDVAVAINTGGISVLLGNGNGTFQPAINTTLPGTGPIGLVVADFNQDGNLDIATEINNEGAENLALLLGNGNGTFQVQVLSLSAAPLAAGDLNGDGKPDLVCQGVPGLEILLNSGNGTFTVGQSLAMASGEVGVVVAVSDLTGNQKMDLVASQFGTHSGSGLPDIVTVLLGNGDGTFAVFPSFVGNVLSPDLGNALGVPAAADFNGDGKIDLAVGNSVLEEDMPVAVQFALLLNDGAGFGPPSVTQLQMGTPQLLPWVAAADFNGDGQMDLAVASSDIAIFLGNGNGTFQPEADYGSQMTGPIAIGDFNNDGNLDVLGVLTNTTDVSVLPGNGNGTFGFPVNSSAGNYVMALAVADFNGDGNLDAAVLTSALQLTMLFGNGNGTFSLGPSYNVGPDPTAIATGDVNGDGIPDLVIGNSDSYDSQTGQFVPSSVVVLLGVGNGTFQPPITTVAGNRISWIAISDFNLDGKADVAISNEGWGDVSLLLGNGDGTFQAPMQFCLNNVAGPLAVADFDGNGSPDLAVSGGVGILGTSNITLLLSQGSGGSAAIVAPGFIAFGNQAVGQPSAVATATLTNTASNALTITSITVSGPQSGDYQQVNDCGTSLSAGADCTISIAFTPQAPGARSAVIQITDSAINSPQVISLSGVGSGSAVSLVPGNISFGNQYVGSSSSSQAVTLTNTGNTTLVITGITFTGAQAGDFSQTNNCPSNLASAASCTVNVIFTPAAGGSRVAALSVTDNAYNSPQSVALTGTGEGFSVTVSSPSQTVSPGQTATYSLNVSPLGGFNQTVQMSCTGAPAESSCSVSPSSFTLNGSASQAVMVTVTTVGTSAGLRKTQFGRPSNTAYGFWIWSLGAFGIVGLVSLAGWRREWRRWVYGLLCICLVGTVIMISACGGSGGGGGTGGIQPGTYNLAVTSTFSSGSTTLTVTTPLTLIVK